MMRIMVRRVVWIGCFILVSGCAGRPPAPLYPPGDVAAGAFAALVNNSEYPAAPDIDVLEIPAAATALVNATLNGASGLRQRLDVIAALFAPEGALGLQYNAQATATAAEAFEQREGNCLAYTHLFIAMARRAGLDARYREVLGVPQWETEGDYVMLNHHIAAYGELRREGTYVVDFGRVYTPQPRFGRVVSDDRARAQHFNNLGARQLVAGDVAAAIALFNRGLTIDAHIGYLWTNLGTAYMRIGDSRRAEIALHEGLRLMEWDVTTINQLTRLYAGMGRPDLAATYRARSEGAIRQNPYLQFTWGIEARDEGRLDAAIAYLRRAARTQPNELYFWLELAKTYALSGRARDALKTFRRADTLVTTAEERQAMNDVVADLMRRAGGAPPPDDQLQ